MAIQDDFTIDTVNKRITYTTSFVDNRPPSIYTVNELYSWLQDTFDEPAYMQYPVPMSAQTPTQYTLLYPWFIDNESMKALYGGSIQTSSWTKSGANGITALRWTSAVTAPDSSDIGETFTEQTTSGATGICLAVDTARQVVWVQNTSTEQFQDGEVVEGPAADPEFTVESTNGFQTGESIWSNCYSVGTLQTNTEVYIGQEDDQLGGTAYHTASTYQRRLEKLDEWWDADVDFTSSPLGTATGHIDLLVQTKELGTEIDSQKLAFYARQNSTVFSHFELTGGAGNWVVPFASTGSDLNAASGAYSVGFADNTGTIAVGDVIENDTVTDAIAGRLRAVIMGGTNLDSATGVIEYYLLGDTESQTTYDRTLIQLADEDQLKVRDGAVTFSVEVDNGAITNLTPATTQSITVTFGNAQYDIDEDSTDEEYACVVDCSDEPLAEVYERMQFLCCRGNQDGTSTNTQDTLLPSAHSSKDEASEFYRGVGDIVFAFDGGQGSYVSEGDYVINNSSDATGVVISVTSGATGTIVLGQVKGTFSDGDQVARPTEHATNRVDVNGTVTSLVDNSAAPFGTFAGGRWFVAQGVVLTNVPAADNNNWQTVDLGGNTIAPLTTRTITFAGLEINDRASLFEVDTAGGTDITKNQNGVSGTAAVSAVTFELDSTIANDVPATGWVRVVDTSDAVNGTEFRYEYSSISGTTVTFRAHANLSGTATSAGSTTRLIDSGAFASFGSDDNVKLGMQIYNITSSEWATVLRKVSDNEIETTPLTGSGTWADTNTWEANQIVVALAEDDTCYFGFIDDVLPSGDSLSKGIKYVAPTNLIARCRFSDPDVGGTRYLPYEQKSITLTNSDLIVTAIRTEDTIAS